MDQSQYAAHPAAMYDADIRRKQGTGLQPGVNKGILGNIIFFKDKHMPPLELQCGHCGYGVPGLRGSETGILFLTVCGHGFGDSFGSRHVPQGRRPFHDVRIKQLYGIGPPVRDHMVHAVQQPPLCGQGFTLHFSQTIFFT